MAENISSFNAKTVLDEHNRQAKRKNAAFKVSLYVIMSLLAIFLLFPYFYMICQSLMNVDEVSTLKFFPSKLMFKNYVTIFKTGGYGEGLMYTLVIIGFNLVVVPLASSLIAYSFAKLRWVGRKVMFSLMLGTMMLPAAVTQLPLYVMYAKFGWLNTIAPFTIPNLFGGGAIYIFLIRQFMMGIPNALEDAAKIDGANTFTRYFKIVLPLCVPVLIYVMVQVFIAYWGDYYGPLVFLNNYQNKGAVKTIALVLYGFTTDPSKKGSQGNEVVFAGAVFMSIIPTILFAIFQKQLIEGVTMSGLKG